MKHLPLIISCAGGFAAGILLGRERAAERSSAMTQRSSSQPRFSANAESAAEKKGAAFDSDDARITRLFSALQEPLLLRRRFEIFEALRDLTTEDLPALMKHVETLPPSEKEQLSSPLISRWFELDRESARDWVRSHKREFWAVDAWAKSNPEAALQEALALTNDPRATRLLSLAVTQLAGGDVAAQMAMLRTLPAGKVRDEVLCGILIGNAQAQPKQAYAGLAEIAPGQQREEARRGILSRWAEEDPAGVLGHLTEILPTLRAGVLGNEVITEIAQNIGAKNPRLVLDWLATLPVEFRAAPAIAAAGAWATKEPIAALDWCMENGVDVARGNRSGFSSWRAGVLGEALSVQPAATIAWLEGRPAGPDRDRLLERALNDSLWRVPKEQLFAADAALAFRLYESLAPESQERLAAKLSERYAEQGYLADLGGWSSKFATGPVRAEAVAGAVMGAYRRDASVVEALLASTATAADRDAALRGFTAAMTDAAPQDAATRALTIGDAKTRRETLGAVIASWQTRDPEGSKAWLRANLQIPEEWKRAWMSPL